MSHADQRIALDTPAPVAATAGGHHPSWLSLGELDDTGAGGLLALVPAPVASLDYSRQSVTLPVPAPLIGGQVPGALADGIWEVHLGQLEQAPSALLYRGYDPDKDVGNISRARIAIEQLGRQPAPFLTLPAQQVVEIAGQHLPLYYVYTDLPAFYALRELRRARALIRIPEVRNEGELLLWVLTHHQLHKRLTLLQRCDVVLTLCSEPWHYDQRDVARALARDEETGEVPDQSYVSRLMTAARQPEIIRQLLDEGMLTLTHVRYLAERIKTDERLRVLVARYAVQEKLTATRMVALINDLLPPSAGVPVAQLVDRGDFVEYVPSDRGPRPVAPPTLPGYLDTGFIATTAMRLSRAAQQHPVAVVPHANPARTTLDPNSFERLRIWLNAQDHAPTIQETEEMLLGFCRAMHQELAGAHLLSPAGKLAATVEAARARHA